jgi:hypothetical protein
MPPPSGVDNRRRDPRQPQPGPRAPASAPRVEWGQRYRVDPGVAE